MRGELKIDLPRPRHNKNLEFAALVDYIYTVMTNPSADVAPTPVAPAGKSSFPILPHARVGGISGLLEIIADQGGREDLPKLAERLKLEIDELLPTIDAAVMLGFAKVAEGDVIITPEGHEFATADVEKSWQIFQRQLVEQVPFVNTVMEVLHQKKSGGVKKDFFVDILDEHFSEAEAERQFETLISWGRYANFSNTTPMKSGSICRKKNKADPTGPRFRFQRART